MNKFNFEDVVLTLPESNGEMVNIFDKMLTSNKKNIISFINPEIIMQQQNNEIHSYFTSTDYNFIDGIGLLFAINNKLNRKYNSTSRYPGTDFFNYLPTNRTIRVFFYGTKPEHLILAKDNIENKYKNIKVVGTIDGFSKIPDSVIIDEINKVSPDILLVCKGCPLQEKWITKNKDKINAKIILGNGGSIDFWSGKVKRAPAFIIKHNLEWLFRLFSNFSRQRLHRQFKLFGFYASYKLNRFNIKAI